MKRSRKIGWVVLLIGLVSAGVVILTSSEPVYEGKTLSEWLEGVERDIWDSSLPHIETNTPAAKAIRHMGTKAVPHLLRHTRDRSTPNRKKLNEWLSIVPFLELEVSTKSPYHLKAAIAFHFLGQLGEQAIPELTANMLNGTNTRSWAGIALAGIGPNGVDALIQSLTNQNLIVRVRAVDGLGYSQTRDNRHISAILDCVDDPQVRWHAIEALGYARQDPDRAIPVLIEALNDKDDDNRFFAADSLRRYEAVAKPAIPALLRMTTSTNRELQFIARGAIEQIDPNALAEAGETSN